MGPLPLVEHCYGFLDYHRTLSWLTLWVWALRWWLEEMNCEAEQATVSIQMEGKQLRPWLRASHRGKYPHLQSWKGLELKRVVPSIAPRAMGPDDGPTSTESWPVTTSPPHLPVIGLSYPTQTSSESERELLNYSQVPVEDLDAGTAWFMEACV